jgi:hypothetical protein
VNEQHAINGKYEWKMDTLSSLKLTVSGLRKTTDQFSHSLSEFRNFQKELTNNSDQAKTNHTTRLQTDNQLTYRQQFTKKNRLLIATLRFGVTDDDQDGTVNTTANFFRNGSNLPDSSAIIDQGKTFNGNSKTVGGKITFNEPLSAKWNMILDYSHNRNNSVSNRNSFNKSLNGKYETPDSLYSNNFDMNVYSHSGSMIFRYMDKKLRMAFGSGLSTMKLNLTDRNAHKDTTYNFLKFAPQVQVGYTFKPQMSMSFNYRGTTRQPSINQLQPLRDNSDPLNVFQGNPGLAVGFNHTFSIFFNQYKILKQRGFWMNLSYNLTENAIVNSTIFDTTRKKQVSSPVNVNGINSWYFFSNWNKGGGPKKLSYGFTVNSNGGRNVNFINNTRNTSDYVSGKASFSIGYDKTDKWSFQFRPEVGYNASRSSINRSINNNYFTFGGNYEGSVMLPGKFELRSELQVDLRKRTVSFPGNTNIIGWNASIGKKVFKDKSGKILLMATDILDQNVGFNRTINSSIISEERYSKISRYFQLRFEWSFTKTPGTN